MTIIAAADGSALGNPGPAGWAWYVDDDRWAAGGWPHGTNNQGELMAVIDLFDQTASHADEDLHVLCDSQYVINAVTKWIPGWKRKGWRKADGSPVMNIELVKRLDAALAGRSYSFEWVKGHAGHDLNEAADVRARAVAVAYQNGSPIPRGPGWPGYDASRNPAAEHEPESTATGDADPEPATLFDIDEPSPTTDDLETVELLERRLLDPAIRSDVAEVSALLHPHFEEIGASGRIWDRETTIQSLEADAESGTMTSVVSLERVAADAVLLVYRSTDARGEQLRSSVWVRSEGRWRLRFHQGTVESP
jgi:ribonuclease HI